MSGILTGPEIRRQVELGGIKISPWDPELVNPASVDLRLGRKVALYEHPGMPNSLGGLLDYPIDCKDPESMPLRDEFEISDGGVCLMPRRLYLMHTEERISTDKFVPVIDGKSSIGRLGISVHETAGYGDCGFDGQYTLEVTTVYPVRVYAGMRFCQMRFHTMEGEPMLYKGNYTGEYSQGPVPSRVWKQFK